MLGRRQANPTAHTHRSACVRSTLSVELIGYQEFEGVGLERLIKLLDDLGVGVEDVGDKEDGHCSS